MAKKMKWLTKGAKWLPWQKGPSAYHGNKNQLAIMAEKENIVIIAKGTNWPSWHYGPIGYHGNMD